MVARRTVPCYKHVIEKVGEAPVCLLVGSGGCTGFPFRDRESINSLGIKEARHCARRMFARLREFKAGPVSVCRKEQTRRLNRSSTSGCHGSPPG
jgi:hypothetical protein